MKIIKDKLSFIAPSTWPIWISLGCLWLIAHLPYGIQRRIGYFIGKLIYFSASSLRHITKINIDLCFPELTSEQRNTLIKKNFTSLGIGLIETAMAWLLSDNQLQQCSVNIHGIEHVEAALAKGHGILLLGPHFTCLEMVGRLLGAQYNFAVMYRPHKKRLVAFIQEHFRRKYKIKQIPRHRMREVLRTLQQNTAIWYAYDVDGGEKRSVFAPFFGIQTASLTTPSRIVQLSNTTVIPIHFYRFDNTWGYEINLLPPLENFPSDNHLDDATRLNITIEQAIRAKPEQYIWQYKRFKTRPIGEKRFY